MPGLVAEEQFACELVAFLAAGREAVEDAVDVAAGVLAGADPGVVAEGESGLVPAGQVCLASLFVGGCPQPRVVLVAVPDHLGDRVEGLAAHRNVFAVVAAHGAGARFSLRGGRAVAGHGRLPAVLPLGVRRRWAWPQRWVSVIICSARAGRIRVWYSAWAESMAGVRLAWGERTPPSSGGVAGGGRARRGGGPQGAGGGGRRPEAGPVTPFPP